MLWSHRFGSTEVVIQQGNIALQAVDAITNAANEELQLGGGVAGAIREAGGKAIQRECAAFVKEHGRVRTGEVAVTGPGRLPCKKVIHAVGPMWSESAGNNEAKLIRTLFSVLECAERERVESLAIPAISSGLFGGPKEVCAAIFLQVLENYTEQHPETGLKIIKLVNNDDETSRIFLRTFRGKMGVSAKSEELQGNLSPNPPENPANSQSQRPISPLNPKTKPETLAKGRTQPATTHTAKTHRRNEDCCEVF